MAESGEHRPRDVVDTNEDNDVSVSAASLERLQEQSDTSDEREVQKSVMPRTPVFGDYVNSVVDVYEKKGYMTGSSTGGSGTSKTVKVREGESLSVSKMKMEDEEDNDNKLFHRLEKLIDERVQLRVAHHEGRIDALIEAVNRLNVSICHCSNDDHKGKKGDTSTTNSDVINKNGETRDMIQRNDSGRIDALVRVVERMADHLQILDSAVRRKVLADE